MIGNPEQRCSRTSNDSQTMRTWRYVARVSQKDADTLPRSAEALDAMLAQASEQDTLKNDQTTTVAKLLVGDQEIILKRYNPRNSWHKVKRALRKSRARRCWKMSRTFSEVGLNVSPPIMMFEDRVWLIRRNAYFANQFLPGSELLTALPSMNDDERSHVKRAVTDAFETLATARISHGDMKATNLLWVDKRLFFIDLDAAQQHSKWSLTWGKSHNKDKRRFVQNWQDQPELLALFADL